MKYLAFCFPCIRQCKAGLAFRGLINVRDLIVRRKLISQKNELNYASSFFTSRACCAPPAGPIVRRLTTNKPRSEIALVLQNSVSYK